MSRDVRQAVTADGLRRHLVALQRIARANGGNRAAGTAGYDASARYVYDTLKAAGYDVRLQQFPFDGYVASVERARQLRPTSRDLEADALEYSPSTKEGGVTARVAVVPVDRDGSHGCEAADFDEGTYSGRIALVKRGECRFAVKARNATAAGAVAVMIYNDEPGPTVHGTLADSDPDSAPVVMVTREAGEALAADAAKHGAVVSLEIRATTSGAKTRNVIAETSDGDGETVVMAGGHLDSVEDGPGMNDNGSGTAALLEIAIQLSEVEPQPNVRFAFWGAEEIGLVGSRYYVERLSRREGDRISLYLNFDMIGSPNAVRYVYDGGGTGSSRGVRGSEAVERLFLAYFRTRGLRADRLLMAGGSDHAAFERREIPTGGLFTGASGTKTRRQATLFGGAAGKPYDACYHKPCDDLTNVDVAVLEEMADAAAHAIVTVAARPSLVGS